MSIRGKLIASLYCICILKQTYKQLDFVCVSQTLNFVSVVYKNIVLRHHVNE